jgi:hypothetical protein
MKTFRHGETIQEMLKKEKDPRRTMYLNEINLQYKKWMTANIEIKSNSPDQLKEKIELYNDYRAFLFSKKFREENTFVRERKLFETALSEFIYYIIKDIDIFEDKNFFLDRAEIPIGFKADYNSIQNIKNENILDIAKQKMRLVIGKNFDYKYRISDREDYIEGSMVLPFVTVSSALVLEEWYIFKLQNQIKRLKTFFPRLLCILVCEVVNNDFNIDLNDIGIDGIYVLQRQTTSMKRRKISDEVISAFLNKIECHLASPKEDIIKKVETGILIG